MVAGAAGRGGGREAGAALLAHRRRRSGGGGRSLGRDRGLHRGPAPGNVVRRVRGADRRRAVGPGAERLAALATGFVFVVLATWIAANVPIARLLSTPLTYGLLHATGSALGDSVARYATVPNVGLPLVLMAGGLAFARWVRPRVAPGRAALLAISLRRPWCCWRSGRSRSGAARPRACTGTPCWRWPRPRPRAGLRPGVRRGPRWRRRPCRSHDEAPSPATLAELAGSRAAGRSSG